MNFEWIENEDGDLAELYVGQAEESVATIMRSNGGKLWNWIMELPINTRKWKTWLPKDDAKAMIERAVIRWFAEAWTPKGTTDPLEFDCCDCGQHVIGFGYLRSEAARCSSCQWIRDHVKPEHHHEVRERLGVPIKRSELLYPDDPNS